MTIEAQGRPVEAESPMYPIEDTRRCPRCGQDVPKSDFYADGDGRPVGYCKTCQSGYVAEYYRAHREDVIAYHTTYVDRNRLRIRESDRDYRAQAKEKSRAYAKEYYQRNREKWSEYSQRRRDTDDNSINPDSLKAMLSDQGGGCCYCGKAMELPIIVYRIPIMEGGTHTIGNIRLSCTSCARSKKGMPDEDYIEWRKIHGVDDL